MNEYLMYQLDSLSEPLPLAGELAALLPVVVEEAAEVAQFLIVVL